jgi:WS/DGAT/MGAT family acyltransferase
MAHFERLDARERLVLALEDAHVHLEAATACVLEAGPLARDGGGVDIDRIRAFVESRLYRVPLCRKRIAYVPLEGAPVWVDDENFNLQYHVRHTHLPVPGDERQLKRLCGRLASQRLDPERPLWELWVVEGLEGDRCALVAKAHESVARGLWGQGLLEALLSPAPDKDFEPGPAWLPRPRPSGRELLEASLQRRLAFPLVLARGAFAMARDGKALRHELERTRTALRGVGPASESPLNQPLGPHRRVDWLALDARALERCAARFSVHGEALLMALLAGALGHFFEQRGLPLTFQRDLHLRAVLPESSEPEGGSDGVALAFRVAELPIAERDPAARVRAAAHALREAPRLSWELLSKAGEWAPLLLAGFARRQIGERMANLALTPFAGPPAPLHLLGARVLEMVPLLPLPPGQAVRVALMPYAGVLRIGFTADWDLVPDLHDLVLASAESFQELEVAAQAA